MAEVSNKSGGSSLIIDYGVSSAKGKIYKSSKTEIDGYEKVSLSSGGVVFHKYLDGLTGRPTYLARQEKEIQSEGKTKKLDNLKLFLNDGSITQALSLKTYSKEWKAFIEKVYNFDFSRPMGLSFYYKAKKDDDTKKYLTCYVYYADSIDEEGKKQSPEWLDVLGKVPPPVKNKKGELDWTDNDVWYEERLEEVIERFKQYKSDLKPPVEAEVPAGDLDDDDLPF